MKPALSHVGSKDEFEYLTPVMPAVHELHLALAGADVSHLVAPGEEIAGTVDACFSPDTAVWLASLVRAATPKPPVG
ncbi:hypothetical protein ACFYVL_43965 [Streptomyces sp. NPDC004111]|uniref:hypothetical protein n=1 Tax=Streptomyces sp. NPDC004111 TaxID=3364690 RepID=UPI0036C6F5A3